jgi:branched-chain amino acid transport system substrate-binding protein
MVKSRLRPLALVAIAALAAAGCGSSSKSSTSGSTAPTSGATQTSAENVLGTPRKATGTPYVFGLINLESGPVTFPEVRQAEQAAVDYVNNYKNGINGHPIKLAFCTADGQPATDTNCANQIVAKHPLLILGGADNASSGAFPVWQRNKLAYIGGAPFTPAESNAPNAAIFISLTVADNAAAIDYAKKTYGVKKASIIFVDDTQGTYTGKIIENEMKNAGIDVKMVPVSTTQSDMSSAAAAAISDNPDLVYDETPNSCPAVLKALKAVGYTGHIGGIDPCTSPPALKSAGSAADGLIFAQPFYSLDSSNADAKLAGAIVAKYAPRNVALNSPALSGLASVLNIQAALSKVSGTLTSDKVLSAFTSTSNQPNFLAHPYTCDRKQVPAQAASCNGYMLVKQVKGGKIETISSWVYGAKLYHPPAP